MGWIFVEFMVLHLGGSLCLSCRGFYFCDIWEWLVGCRSVCFVPVGLISNKLFVSRIRMLDSGLLTLCDSG